MPVRGARTVHTARSDHCRIVLAGMSRANLRPTATLCVRARARASQRRMLRLVCGRRALCHGFIQAQAALHDVAVQCCRTLRRRAVHAKAERRRGQPRRAPRDRAGKEYSPEGLGRVEYSSTRSRCVRRFGSQSNAGGVSVRSCVLWILRTDHAFPLGRRDACGDKRKPLMKSESQAREKKKGPSIYRWTAAAE